ncbi:MAG: hypothetical protein WB502_07115 [Thermoactinomyces sp.]
MDKQNNFPPYPMESAGTREFPGQQQLNTSQLFFPGPFFTPFFFPRPFFFFVFRPFGRRFGPF